MVKLVLLILAIANLVCPTWVHAEVQFYAQVEPEVGTLDTVFQLSLTLEDSDAEESPILESNSDFTVHYRGPISRVQIIQGKVSRQRTWVYALTPSKEGALRTPSATITVNKEKLRTEQIVVRVNPLSATPIPRHAPASAPDGVILRQHIETPKAYVGEQIALNLDLLTAISLYEPQFPDLVYDGFIVRTIADNVRGTETINGISYDKLQFRRALFGLREGKQKLEPRTINAKIQSQKEKFGKSFPFEQFNPFDLGSFEDFFAGRTLQDVKIQSNELLLEVLPLPEKPNNFPQHGLAQTVVGETTVEASLDRNSLLVGETAIAKVTITSTGNIAGIKGIDLKLPPSFQVYEEAVELKEFEVGGLLVTQKRFPIALVPSAGGQFTIPSFQLGYWEPSSRSYRIAQGPKLELNVAGPALSATPEPSANAEQQSAKTEDSLPYVEAKLWERVAAWVSVELFFYFIAALLSLGLCVLLLLRSLSLRQPKQKALKQLRSARELDELKTTFCAFLISHFSLSLDVRGVALREQLKVHAISKANMFAIESLLDDLDAKLYGHDQSGIPFAQLKERALALVRVL